MTKEGVLVIVARRFRTQAQNRDDAMNQLVDLLRRAEIRPKAHLKTRVPLGQKKRRREDKTKHGEKKKLRQVKIGREE
jgi:ribosome-associated protein